MKASSKLETVSLETGMLAYARSIQITEGLFFATRTKDGGKTRTPVEILEKGVRGQSSEDRAANAGKSNPQSVEFAIVPQSHDGIELEFGLRFIPQSMKPHACGNANVGATYRRLAEAYRRAGGFRMLAELYAWNIANARFAWRNRYQSDEMSVIVSFGKEVRFDPMLLRLERPADLAEMETAMASGERTDLEALIEGIERGLSDTDPERPFVTKVIWAAKMEPGQEIFPSQEYLRDDLKGKPRYKDVSRVLAKLRTEFAGCMIDQASMHSQKIGAALRHIDIWHDSDSYDVIPVNPYGGIQETGEVLRGTGTKTSFYDIRKKADVLLNAVEGAESAAGLTGEAHFVMANLVRGGVFGSSTKKAEENG